MQQVRGLGAGDILDLWERADGLGPMERALALAAAGAGPAPTDASALADAPLGRCNALILGLRTALFGAALTATAGCPTCGETVEFEADGRALACAGDVGPAGPGTVELDGWRAAWRPPSHADVAAAGAAAGADPAEVLLARCVVSVSGPDGPATPAGLPAAVRAAVGEAMAAADPLAEIVVELSCPACGAEFSTEIDLGAFVWAELRARARRMLLEVDLLARAYGWTEAEVLALGEARRAAYLRVVTEGTP